MMLPEHDLASLVLLSDFIVLVDQFERETTPGGSKIPWCRVTKVYKGAVLPGVEFPRPRLDSYTLDTEEVSGESSKWDKEAAFFLVKKVGPKHEWDAHAIEVVSSGLRLFKSGATYSFYQWLNPGGYVPMPETRVEDGSEVRFPDFEKGLLAAILRVGRLEWAQSLPNRKERTETMLEILGPPVVRSTFWYESWRDSSSDLFTPRVFESLGATRKMDLTLEAFSRCRSCDYTQLRGDLRALDFLNAACDPARSAPRRATALWCLQTRWLPLRFEQYEKLATLLGAKEPEVRRGAAGVIDCILTTHGSSWDKPKENEECRPLVQALLEAWRLETDPLARTVIFSAGDLSFFRQAAGPTRKHPILLEGCIVEGTAHFVHAFLNGLDRVVRSTIVVAVPVEGGMEHRSPPLRGDESVRMDGRVEKLTPAQLKRNREIRARSFWLSTGLKRFESSYVEFDPPLAPGKYKMWIEGRYPVDDIPTLPQDPPELVLTTRPCEVVVEPEPSNPENPK